MKICIVSPYWKNTIGGVTTVVLNLAREFQLLGYQVVVMTSEDDDSESYPVHRFSNWCDLLLHLLKERPNVIHVHGHGSLLPGVVLFKALVRDVRVVFTFHTQPHRSHEVSILGWLSATLRNLVLRLLLHHVDRVTCVSRSLADNLGRYKGIVPRHLFVVPNGISSCFLKRCIDTGDDLCISDSKEQSWFPRVLMVGVMNWNSKAAGMAVLIEAMTLVRREYPNTHLVLVGDGAYRKELERCADEMDVAEITEFAGECDDPIPYYKQCDIYAHISFNEAQGVAILEAMACELPVVGANCGGIPETVKTGVTGLLVPPTAPDVAEAICRLAADEALREKMGINGRKAVINGFTWTQICLRYLQVFGEPTSDDNAY